jgi:hypothetical protein
VGWFDLRGLGADYGVEEVSSAAEFRAAGAGASKPSSGTSLLSSVTGGGAEAAAGAAAPLIGTAGAIGLAVVGVAAAAGITTTLIMKDREKRARKKEDRKAARDEFQRSQETDRVSYERAQAAERALVAARRQVESTVEAIRALARRVTVLAQEALAVAARIGDGQASAELREMLGVVDVVVGSVNQLEVSGLEDAAEADAARIDLGRARSALEDARAATAAGRTRLLDLEVVIERDRRRAEAAAKLAAERERLEELRARNAQLRAQLAWELQQLEAERLA